MATWEIEKSGKKDEAELMSIPEILSLQNKPYHERISALLRAARYVLNDGENNGELV